MSRKEIWLYERINAYGEIHPHLYVVTSNEHPSGQLGLATAEFVEDVYTHNVHFRKLDQGQAFENLKNGRYRYVNYSKSAILQEWVRPVFSSKKTGTSRPNFLWETFLKQAKHIVTL